MQWVAPSERDNANHTLEKRLWEAADQLRANSGLTSAQYSTPVLGLIFLRFAEARFAKRRAQLEKSASSSRRGPSRIDDPGAYHADGVIYLTPNARYDRLLNLPEGENVGKEINEAMAEIEKHNPQLAGVLPRTYQIFNSTLLKELLKKVSEIPHSLEFDAFGRIYEYFLAEFARTEGQKGGEFFTPSSIVRLIVEIIEPFHGRLLDLASGSGGMFVQSARFVQEHKTSSPSPVAGRRPLPVGEGRGEGLAVYSGEPSRELSLHGQERVGATAALSRMNLAVHGLEGDVFGSDPMDGVRRVVCGARREDARRVGSTRARCFRSRMPTCRLAESRSYLAYSARQPKMFLTYTNRRADSSTMADKRSRLSSRFLTLVKTG